MSIKQLRMNLYNFLNFYSYITHESYINRTQCLAYCDDSNSRLVPYYKVDNLRKVFDDNHLKLARISNQLGQFYPRTAIPSSQSPSIIVYE